MKNYLLLFAVAAIFIISCGSQPTQSTLNQKPMPKRQVVIEEGGTGDYKAVMFEDTSLKNHTIFCPKDLTPFSASNPLPVIVWSNGSCFSSPHEHLLFLNEIASQGYLVVANGLMPRDTIIFRGAMSKPENQIASINWAFAKNLDTNSYLYDKIDTNRIAAAGTSCGGLQTLYNCHDSRIKTIMLFNSGLFIKVEATIPGMTIPPKSKLEDLHTPILYVLGDTMDIAYQNGMDDFYRIKHVPACVANYPVGHSGTFAQPHGGEFAIIALAWLNWQLKANQQAAKMFLGKSPEILNRQDWKFEKNDLFDK